LQRQALRRTEAAVRRRRLNLIVSIAGTIVVVGVVIGIIAATTGSGSSATSSATSAATSAVRTGATHSSSAAVEPTSTTAPSSPSSAPARSSSPVRSSSKAAIAAPAPTTRCTYRTSGKAARAVARPAATAPRSGDVSVRVATSQGTLQFRLDRAAAPCTVNSFLSLARQRFYNHTPCHRLVTKGIYIVQCGDPTGTGSGGPGYAFDDELTGRETYTRGVVAMANGGPNTDGSQFFVVDKKSALGPQFTVFGTVSAGIGVIDKVSRAGTKDGSTDGPPKLPLTLTTVTVG
jgi:peptidyl-prolyl cis-trans isomerase B (cyclophilin B)